MKLIKERILTNAPLLVMLLVLIGMGQSVNAQEKIINSKVKEVKVYFNGAQVSRNAVTTLSKGTTLVIFDGIADNIDKLSIQLGVTKGVDILSVSHNVNFQKKPSSNTLIKRLTDSLNLMNDYIKGIEIQNNVMTTEEGILKANQSLGGSQQGVSSAELSKIIELNRTRLTEIQTQKYKNSKKIVEANQLITSLTQKIASERHGLPTAKGEIRVMVYAKNNINAEFELNYFARQAGWIPSYNIKTDGPGSQTKLTYKAEVYQSTGEIWNNIKLSVSSSEPLSGIELPALETEYVKFAPPMLSPSPKSTMRAESLENGVGSNPENSLIMSSSLNANLSSNENIFEFSIPNPFTIPNDGKARSVSMAEYEINVDFEYYSIPKRDPSVFLTGIASNWKGLNLLPGNANMFLGENFAGQFYINPSASDDSLRLSFGRDKRISIERKLLNDFSKKSFLGSTQKQTYSYEIVINNSRNSDIKLRLIDQVPISKDAEIKIDVDELSDGKINKSNGFIEWTLTLKPQENRKFKFIYTIVSPKSKEVYKH